MCDINKGLGFQRSDMGLKKKLAALVGLVLISVSIANVELGARCRTSHWYPALAPLPKKIAK